MSGFEDWESILYPQSAQILPCMCKTLGASPYRHFLTDVPSSSHLMATTGVADSEVILHYVLLFTGDWGYWHLNVVHVPTANKQEFGSERSYWFSLSLTINNGHWCTASNNLLICFLLMRTLYFPFWLCGNFCDFQCSLLIWEQKHCRANTVWTTQGRGTPKPTTHPLDTRESKSGNARAAFCLEFRWPAVLHFLNFLNFSPQVLV